MRLDHDTIQERRQIKSGKEGQSEPDPLRRDQRKVLVAFPSLGSVPCSWTHPSSGSRSILSLLPINSYFLSQLTWTLSLEVRRLDYHREQRQTLGDTLTQLLCGFHTDTGIHALSVSRHQKIQTGLHNNHTSVFLGENKIECPTFVSNHRTSSYTPAIFFTIS